jgi:hypothetical protein
MTAAPRLGDELFLSSIDDTTGKFRQHPRAIALGLSGALLAELILTDRIAVRHGAVAVVNHKPPADALAHIILDHVIGEAAPRSVRTWLHYFAQTAVERVGSRLERAGYLERIETRRLGRRQVHWLPTDPAAAAMPEVRLRYLLQTERPLEVADATLVGLLEAAGLARVVLWGFATRTLQYRDFVLSALPLQLGELLRVTRTAVADMVVSHRV